MNLTSKQLFQIASVMLTSLITGAALFTTLFGPDLTPKIIAGLGLANIMVNSFGIAFSTQASLVQDVAAMPGVDRISINAQASSGVASVATDPAQSKVGGTTAAVQQILNDKVKGA